MAVTGMQVARDRRLVARLLRADESAFQSFFEDYFPRLFRFALGRLNHDADLAEEIVQSALVRAVGKLDTYRGEAALFTWLCTFCRNEISATFRRGRYRYETELVEESTEVRAAINRLVATGLDDPRACLDRSELLRSVHATLDRLPQHYAQALSWKYLDEQPVKTIASRLDLHPKAAESLLTRARQAFREGFADDAVPNTGPPRGRVATAGEPAP